MLVLVFDGTQGHGDIDHRQKPQADREENIFIPLSSSIIQIESEFM